MQKILFRGVPKDESYQMFANWKPYTKNGFIYGSLFMKEDKSYICVSVLRNCKSYINNGLTTMLEVIPDTIGQFTGQTDKNKTDIFTGDVIKYRLPNETEYRKGCVVWDNDNCRFCIKHSKGIDAFCKEVADNCEVCEEHTLHNEMTKPV